MLSIFPNNTLMHKFTPVGEVLISLARSRPADFVKEDNSINQTTLATFLGIGQPTISRIFKEDDYELRRDVAYKVAARFNITMSQARGETPLRRKDMVIESPLHGIISDEVAGIIDTLPDSTKRVVLNLVRDLAKNVVSGVKAMAS